jgi:hypothetical protein
MLTLHLYKYLLIISVLSSVIVSFLIITKEQRLPNKINSVRATIEALVS